METRLWMALRILVIGIAITTISGCKSDQSDSLMQDLVSASGARGDNQAPVISGSPKAEIPGGQEYEFTPRAYDPDGQPLTFGVKNKPAWSSFNAKTGRLSGTPSEADVGVFANIVISASDGSRRSSMKPFTVKVTPRSTQSKNRSQPLPAPVPRLPPPEGAGVEFRFAEVPEIVFLRGYSETEHMGIFHLDTLNRWRPGDLTNAAGWSPRVVTDLVITSGNLTGVTYDPSSGVLSYDGSGSGTETVTARLVAPDYSAESAEFNIRVLQPTVAWGKGASKTFPGIGYDSSTTSWKDMQKLLKNDAPYSSPNVLVVTQGKYAEDYYIGGSKLNLYILGEPNARPTFTGDLIALQNFETAYLKNLELHDTVVSGGKYLTDRPINLYVTKVFQHDSTRDLNGFGTPAYEGKSQYGVVAGPAVWKHWFWNFHGSQMGGTSNTRHQFYLEGRPNSYVLINNIRIDGTRSCSAIKSTRYNNIVRNSYISTLLDPADPNRGLRAAKLIDIAAAGETVLFNNEFIGARTDERGGVSSALIFMRARRSWWGADTPAYPDVSWENGLTSVHGGGYLAPEGFTAGPETFKNPEFWNVVRSYDLGDPQNPYSFKKFVSYNTFRWIDEGERRSGPYRDDGTAPRTAAQQFSNAEHWGTVTENWTERSVAFFANNSYVGWSEEDMTMPKRWFNYTGTTSESLVTKVGPGPWAYPSPPRGMLDVGGEMTPANEPSLVEMPSWFRY